MSRLRVLCLDIEGGYGGSSRSLFMALAAMDRAAVDLEVWCRKDGPIQARYAAIGVPVRVMPAMPSASALPRLSRNLIHFGRFFRAWPATAGFRRELAGAVRERFDVVHFNHEGLFWLARWLRRRRDGGQTMHIRTMVHDTVAGRWQHRVIAGAVDRAVYISENERDNVARLAGRAIPGPVIANPAPPPMDAEPHPGVRREGARLIAVSLANFALIRGTDRLLDVAEALRRRGRDDICLVVGGAMTLPGGLPGDLGAAAARGESLADVAAARGLAPWFQFLGHIPDPERVLAAGDVLLRPSREDNAWGRDVIEAQSAGLPVVAAGHRQTFVEDGVTGVMLADYDAEAMADALCRLADDPAWRQQLGDAARERVARLCDPAARAADLLDVWREVAR